MRSITLAWSVLGYGQRTWFSSLNVVASMVTRTTSLGAPSLPRSEKRMSTLCRSRFSKKPKWKA